MLRTWIVIYAFVGIQLGWSFSGLRSSATPDQPAHGSSAAGSGRMPMSSSRG